MPTTVILIDDHALVRDGIKRLLEDGGDYTVIAQADDGQAGIELIRKERPDLAILDIRMPRMNGIEAVAALRKAGDPTPCLMLSMHDSEEYVLQSIRAGAHGYLLKDTSREEFLKASGAVSRGERYFSGDLSHILVKHLTAGGGLPANQSSAPASAPNESGKGVKISRRQKEILEHVARGDTNQEIADALGLGRRTVETHRYKLMEKLGVSNKGELLRRARDLGLV